MESECLFSELPSPNKQESEMEKEMPSLRKADGSHNLVPPPEQSGSDEWGA